MPKKHKERDIKIDLETWVELGLAVERGDERESRMAFHKFMKSEYDETKNPLYVWETFLHARRHQLPVPEWVMDYLEKAAKKLVKTIDNKLEDIPDHLGFKTSSSLGGGPQHFKQFFTRRIQQDTAWLVEALLAANKDMTVEAACGEAIAFVEERSHALVEEPDVFTIKEWYYKFTKKGYVGKT